MNMNRLALVALCMPGVLMADIKDEIPPWLLEDDEQERSTGAGEEPVVVMPWQDPEGVEYCEPTPELLAEVAEYINARMAEVCPTVKGGPGLSEETAWVLGPDVYPDPSLLCSVLPEDYEEMDACGLEGKNGRNHFVVDFLLTREGKVYGFTYWVDTHDAALELADEEEVNEEEEAEEGAVDLD